MQQKKRRAFETLGAIPHLLFKKKKLLNFFCRIVIFCSSYSPQKASYTLQFFFKVIFKYLFINFAKKRWAFGTFGSILDLYKKCSLKNISRISFLWSSYSLKEASYNLQFFFKVIVKYLFLNFAKRRAFGTLGAILDL